MLEFKPDMIIWSADVPREDIERVMRSGALPCGTIIKLDRLFFETEDKEFIRQCEDSGYPVFCDAKIIEVPSKSLAIAEHYLKYRPFMLNIMAGACSTGIFDTDDINQLDALKRFHDACNNAGTRSCVVTVLTSKSANMVAHEYSNDPIGQVLRYIGIAYSAGIRDIVCSPAEVQAIRAGGRDDRAYLSLITPGVRLAGSSHDDQQRVMTPGQAIALGASRVVIGRPLTSGNGPIEERVAENYRLICNDIIEEISK